MARSSSQCPNNTHAPVAERGPGRFSDQSGLTETCLTRDQEHLAAFAPGDTLERIQQRGHLGFPAHDTRRRAYSETPRKRDADPGVGPAERFPQNLDGMHRIGQTLQGEFAERMTFVPAAAASSQSHDVCSQHLPALTAGAEPGRFDDRVAEVVVVLVTDLAPAQPDPQAHRVLTTPVVAFDALLHRHRARQRSRRGAEHDHEPVTEILHVSAARLGDRLTQDRKMPATQFVRGVRRQIDASAVEPTMSVNNTITFSVVTSSPTLCSRVHPATVSREPHQPHGARDCPQLPAEGGPQIC